MLKIMKDFTTGFFILLLILGSINCASQKHYKLGSIITQEEITSIPKPKVQKVSLYENAIENMLGREIDEYGNISWHNRKLTNNHKQAKNTNALDEVPNSSWFTNRNGKYPMNREELKRGPNRGTGPDMEGPLTIIGAKVEGVSPGFTIKDRKGDIYFIKFDAKGYPQLNTAAEVITSKFVYAVGYNAPENYLSTLDPKRLQIAKGVKVKNRWGKDVPMKFEFVQKVWKKVHPNPDGSYRVVASKLLEGEALGPFLFAGRRKDDPNDNINHNHRRELRGYKVIAAWLNNNDVKANNTLDMYVEKDDKYFVKHYMLDFGTSLGSSGYGLGGRSRGHKGAFDLGHMLKKTLSLGLWVERWEKEPRLVSRSVGYFESRLFNPEDYAQLFPNLSFQKATELDGFWGAKIVMSFTDQQIRAIVETGEYENQEDEDYIVKTLIERRDKTGRYWYSVVNPIDNFRFAQTNGSNGHQNANSKIIEFDDLSVNAGFENAERTTYRYKLKYRGKDLTNYSFSKGNPSLSLNSAMHQVIEKLFNEKTNIREDDKILTFKIESKRSEFGSWGKAIQVHFYYPIGNEKAPQIVAIEREN
ncbi:hypothetical protein IH879_11795 [candidate division KSB1 bacterium]|nr:hypothetical protein [candidate division KSB1 bacterium]